MSVGGAAGGGLLAGKAKIAVAALVVVGGGGAAVVATGGDVPFLGGADGMVDTVPSEVDAVMYMDPAIVDDGATQALLEELGSMSGSSQSSNPDDLKANFENQTGLAYDDLNSVTFFARYPDDGSGSGTSVGPGPASQLGGTDYAAALIDSGWAEADFVAAMEDAPSGDATTVYAEQEYEGYTVYVQQPGEDDVRDFRQDTENPTWVGVISDGQYVVGSEDAVKDALDVDAGNADSFGGDLRSAYDGARDGYVKFASTVPEDQVGSGVAAQSAQDVTAVAGTYYSAGGETVGMEVRMETNSSSDAEDIIAQIDGGLATVEESTEDENVTALLDSVETSQQGATAVVTFEADATTIAAGVRAFTGLSGGVSASASGGFSGSMAGPAERYGAVAAPRAAPA